jgi:6,7-dimethyl-8-ribityllumazine synthase
MESAVQIAVIVSRFNNCIGTKLLQGAEERCQALKSEDSHVTLTVFYVPGAVEIPLAAQRLAQTGRYQAIMCLGAVIRGETGHYDAVCQQVSYGCQRVALDCTIPVIFGVLTTENTAQALARSGGKAGNKGAEALETAVEMISVLREIDGGT